MANPLALTVISDTHYYSEKTGTCGKAYDTANAKSQKLLVGSRELLQAAFSQIKKDTRSDILLISGDTTNNGELDAHSEFIEMLRDLKESGKRVYVITATHDYQDDGVSDGYAGDEKISAPAAKRSELYEMYREFGPDEAIALHRESMSYIIQLADGYRLFALNDDSNLAGKSGFSDELFDWITEQAQKAKDDGQFIIAMTHHPLIAPSPVYEIIGSGDMLGDYEVRREQLADLDIQFILTGHTHVHDIDKIVSRSGNTLYDIATASTVGYPAVIRNVVLDSECETVTVTTDYITEPVALPMGGKNLQEYLADQMIGTVKTIIEAAGKDTEKFADAATAISISKKLSYKIGWLIKYPVRALCKLRLGTVGSWTKAETGLKKSDYSDIKDKSVLSIITDAALNLFAGKNLYTPDDREYKIAVGLLNIIDSVIKALHIPFKKLVKVSDSVRGIIEPLLYDGGIPSYNAVLPVMPNANSPDYPKTEGTPAAETVKQSKKGIPIVIISVLIIIILLPLLLPILLFGFIKNQIKYGKYLK